MAWYKVTRIIQVIVEAPDFKEAEEISRNSAGTFMTEEVTAPTEEEKNQGTTKEGTEIVIG